jgi:hypothetical protein
MATVFAEMAASLDGFIRSASGDLSWLDDAMARTTPPSPAPGTCAPTPATWRG